MNTNIYDYCSENPNYSEILSENISNQNSYNDPVNKTIKIMNNNLCDMRVSLAEANATLQFLAQIMCRRGTICEIEKNLLINLEKALKDLGTGVKENSSNLDYLDCLVH